MNNLAFAPRDDLGPVRLRLAEPQDLELLRTWRNRHTHRFFQQESVTPEAQRRWYESYLTRPDDYMFMVLQGPTPIGCIGGRLVGKEWDVYNPILGVLSSRYKGSMDKALALLISFLKEKRDLPVRAEVLSDNLRCLAFVQRGGFVKWSEKSGSVVLYHQRTSEPSKDENA